MKKIESRKLTQLKIRSGILKSLAHPARLFLVENLAKKKLCVCQLTQLIGADISTVSRHLSLLKNAGVIEDEKHGTQVFYRLRTPCILKILECVESCMESTIKENMKLIR